MHKNTIYYFSATGNSLAVAQSIAEKLGDTQVLSIPEALANGVMQSGSEAIGFVFPVHMADAPKMVKEFVEGFPVKRGTYYFAVSTCGTFSCNEFSTIDDILCGSKALLNYSASVRMVGNYILLYDITDKVTDRLAEADEQLVEIAEQIKNRQENFFRRTNKMLSYAAAKFEQSRSDSDRGLTISKACTLCGTCAQVCPAHNITMDEDAPHHHHNCQRCLACVHWCPSAAVDFGRMTRGRSRYHHPSIDSRQLP